MLRNRPASGIILLCVILLSILTSCAGLLFSTASQEFEKGLAYFNQGNYDQAIPHFKRATELDPNYGKAYLYLGRSYLNLKKWTQAIQPLRTAFRLEPQESQKEIINILLDALIGAGISEFMKGNFLGSINYLKEGLSLVPQSDRAKNELVRSLIGYGGTLVSEGNYSEAISAFSDAVKLSPNNADALVGLAKAFLSNGDFLKALQTVQKALAVDSDNRPANTLLRELLQNK